MNPLIALLALSITAANEPIAVVNDPDWRRITRDVLTIHRMFVLGDRYENGTCCPVTVPTHIEHFIFDISVTGDTRTPSPHSWSEGMKPLLTQHIHIQYTYGGVELESAHFYELHVEYDQYAQYDAVQNPGEEPKLENVNYTPVETWFDWNYYGQGSVPVDATMTRTAYNFKASSLEFIHFIGPMIEGTMPPL